MDLIDSSVMQSALAGVFQPMLIVSIVAGVLIGLVFGAMPGLTATAGVAIATPLTFGMGFEAAMALLLGIYCGGYYAGSIPAILLNTPGSPGNAATSLDGYQMALKGEADRALGLSILASVVGGIISVMLLMTIAPLLARLALKFTSVEYAVFGLFGLTCVAAISGKSLIKGIIGAVLGMYLGLVGIDQVSGMQRLTLGMPQLMNGIPLLPALIALFALAEVLSRVTQQDDESHLPVQQRYSALSALREMLRHKWLTVKSSLIGTFIGILPGTGPTIAAWIAYGETSRSEKTDTELGKGSPRGVIAAESSNNAVTGGALVPLLTLGIPGDTVTAVLIGALLIQGITPGPSFIGDNPILFTQILVLLILAYVCVLVVAMASRRWLPHILSVPLPVLLPIIAVLCAAGGYSVNNLSFDVILIAVLGIAGFVLLRVGIPMAPIVLGLVLGPIIEGNLRQAMTVHDMDFTVFITRPISAVLLLATLFMIVWAWRRWSKA